MGNFKRAIKTLVGKGTKAMYDILKSGEFHNNHEKYLVFFKVFRGFCH
jgi:hypothetical protein